MRDDGALVLGTGLGEVALSKPVAYQESDGRRVGVEVAYRLYADGYGFKLGRYDPSCVLTIDPLLQSTYLGGSDDDQAYAIAVTASDVYVGGPTSSPDFPGTTGGPSGRHRRRRRCLTISPATRCGVRRMRHDSCRSPT